MPQIRPEKRYVGILHRELHVPLQNVVYTALAVSAGFGAGVENLPKASVDAHAIRLAAT